MATIISVDEDGTVTLPAEARQRLQLRGPTSIAVEVREDGVLLRPAQAAAAEESWVARDVSKSFLRELIHRADEANAAGRDVTTEELAAWLDQGEAEGHLRRVPEP